MKTLLPSAEKKTFLFRSPQPKTFVIIVWLMVGTFFSTFAQTLPAGFSQSLVASGNNYSGDKAPSDSNFFERYFSMAVL